MAEALRLFVLAGEPSGDRIGADLVQRLGSRVTLDLAGVGGQELEAVGLRSLFPMRDLSVMGWADVLPRLPLLLRRAGQVATEIARQRPDVTVLIDSQVFSALVARRLRKAGYDRPILLYVAPAVWAWKPDRARRLVPLFDEVLCVLPFEPQVMARLAGPPASFVGHPAVARMPPRPTQPERGPLLLLPGSRDGELRRHLPLMRDIAGRFMDHPAVERLVIPTIASARPRVAEAVGRWDTPIDIVVAEADRRTIIETAIAAVAVTGTVTLELALATVPMVTTYVADGGQARLFLRYRPKFAALPNILLDRPLVPEILGIARDPDRVADALGALLDNPQAAAAQRAGFAEIHRLMSTGLPDSAIADPADRVLAHAAR